MVIQDKANLTAGEDILNYPTLKRLPHNTIKTITNLSNKIWSWGTIIYSWKKAIIILIPKESKYPQGLEAYRPISLTSNSEKVLENHDKLKVKIQLLEHNSVRVEKEQVYHGPNNQTR